MADMRARGYGVGHTRDVATYDEQKRLYVLYEDDPAHHSTAANPDAPSVEIAPPELGFIPFGSLHMIQGDGYGHAIDYWWSGPTNGQAHSIAAGFGLVFPLYATLGEWWHAQFWHAGVIAIAPNLLNPPEEDDDMVPVYREPTVRPGQTPKVQDFTNLPADSGGQSVFGVVISSVLQLRRVGDVPTHILVYFNGQPQGVDVPADGSSTEIPVRTAGLCSVVGDGIVVNSREIWTKG